MDGNQSSHNAVERTKPPEQPEYTHPEAIHPLNPPPPPPPKTHSTPIHKNGRNRLTETHPNRAMPNRSQKKRPQPQRKRLQVTDDNGWTHVTTNGNARRAVRSAASSSANPALALAEAPRGLTVDELKRRFQGHREKWEASESWRVVGGVLGGGSGVSAIVCVGLGSPSGFLKGGWVDRRSVSMYQLAALVCVRDALCGIFFRSSVPAKLTRYPKRQIPTLGTHPPRSSPRTPSSTTSTKPSSRPSA